MIKIYCDRCKKEIVKVIKKMFLLKKKWKYDKKRSRTVRRLLC